MLASVTDRENSGDELTEYYDSVKESSSTSKELGGQNRIHTFEKLIQVS